MKHQMELAGLLQGFTGSSTLYRYWANKGLHYTEGVKAFADHAGGGAYWLLDILMTEPAITKAMRNLGIVFVYMDVLDDKATLTVIEDSNIPPLFERAINFTDCPPGRWRFYFSNGVLMLPTEY